MAQPTTCAGDDNPLPWACVAALQCGVDGDTGAEHGRGLLIGNPVRDQRDVVGRAQGVLLESTRGVISRDALVEAQAVRAGVAGLAVCACVGDPLDADSIADFEAGSLRAWTQLGDSSDAFVATDLAGLCREGEDFPLVIVRMLVDRLFCICRCDVRCWS